MYLVKIFLLAMRKKFCYPYYARRDVIIVTTAEKIKTLRIAHGMTQEELGKAVGVQRAAINKYEKGTVVNIKRSVLQKLADTLGVLPVDLLDDEDIMNRIYFDEEGMHYIEGTDSIERSIVEKLNQLEPYNLQRVEEIVDMLIKNQDEIREYIKEV